MRSYSYGLVHCSLALGLSGLAACSSPVASPADGGSPPGQSNLPITCITVARGGVGTVTDTQLASGAADQNRNFGASSLLDTGPFNGGQSQILIKMDPGTLPPILQFLSATLQLQVSQAGSGPILAYAVPVAWDEAAVTNNSFFANVDPSQLQGVAAGLIAPGSSVLNIDLSQFAYSVGQGAPNYGILLQQMGPDPYVFYSSETVDPTYRPTGEICFHPDLCKNVACSAQDQCHSAGSCDPTTGKCTNPTKADGTSCDDGSPATSNDLCAQGVCKGSAPGNVYPLFAGGSGFSCPTGSTVWVLASGTLSPTSSAQAKVACEACYGAGQCYNSDEDSGGLAWGPMSAMPPSCKQAYFGYTKGITGDTGRAWAMCNSSQTFGYWGKQP
jgi:hypothetical protein